MNFRNFKIHKIRILYLWLAVKPLIAVTFACNPGECGIGSECLPGQADELMTSTPQSEMQYRDVKLQVSNKVTSHDRRHLSVLLIVTDRVSEEVMQSVLSVCSFVSTIFKNFSDL